MKHPGFFERAGPFSLRAVADATGSVIGLVTFGDEVVGFSRVFADDAAVRPPEWEADDEAMPPVGTAATIILTRRR